MKKRQYKHIQTFTYLDKETRDYVKTIAETNNKSISQTIKEIIEITMLLYAPETEPFLTRKARERGLETNIKGLFRTAMMICVDYKRGIIK